MNLKQAMNLEYVLKKYLDQLGITENVFIFCEKNSSWKISFNEDDYVNIDEYTSLNDDYEELQSDYEDLEIEKEDLENEVSELEDKVSELEDEIENLKEELKKYEEEN